MRTTTALTACAALLIAGAPVAHADGQSFISDLQGRGVPYLMLGGVARGDAGAIDYGYKICGQLRNGEPPDVAARQFIYLGQWGPQIVDSAQHNLCPDTLH